jgi:voltage-gated potassium channel
MEAERADQQKRAAWLNAVERWTDLPLTALALVLAAVLLAPQLFTLSSDTQRLFSAIDNLIWGVFAADLIVKVAIAPNRMRYVRSHWFDVLLVLLPFLRLVRPLRAFRVLRIARLVRVGAALIRVALVTRRVLYRRDMHYVLLTALLVVIASGGLVTAAERSSESA